MKRIFALLFTVLLTLTGCREEAPKYAWPDGPVLIVSDGIGAGDGLKPGELAFPALLKEELGRVGYPFKVVNESASGLRTQNGATALPSYIDKHHPSTVVICLGATDVFQGVPTSLIKANLERMISTCRTNRVKCILVGMVDHPLYEELAKATDTPLISNVMRGLQDTQNLNQGYLPNQSGHQSIATTIWSGLKLLL